MPAESETSSAYAYFRVTSTTLSLDAVSAILGHKPDRGRSLGEPLSRPNSTRQLASTFTSWVLDSGFERSSDLEAHLSGLRPRVATVARNMGSRHPDLECTLQIVQSGARQAFDGIHLDADWVELLSSLSASIDIDQYGPHESSQGERMSGNAWHQKPVGQWIEAWAAHVVRLREEATGSVPEDWWGAHDFLAALYIRGFVAKGVGDEVPAAVRLADEAFRDFTEHDADDAIHALDPGAPREGWWWERIPRSGPARAEFDDVVAARDSRG